MQVNVFVITVTWVPPKIWEMPWGLIENQHFGEFPLFGGYQSSLETLKVEIVPIYVTSALLPGPFVNHIWVIGFFGAARSPCAPAPPLLDHCVFTASKILPSYQRAATREPVCLSLQSDALSGTLLSLLQQRAICSSSLSEGLSFP